MSDKPQYEISQADRDKKFKEAMDLVGQGVTVFTDLGYPNTMFCFPGGYWKDGQYIPFNDKKSLNQ